MVFRTYKVLFLSPQNHFVFHLNKALMIPLHVMWLGFVFVFISFVHMHWCNLLNIQSMLWFWIEITKGGIWILSFQQAVFIIIVSIGLNLIKIVNVFSLKGPNWKTPVYTTFNRFGQTANMHSFTNLDRVSLSNTYTYPIFIQFMFDLIKLKHLSYNHLKK